MKIIFFLMIISTSNAWSISFKEWTALTANEKTDYLDKNLPDLTWYLNPQKKMQTTLKPERLKILEATIKIVKSKLGQYTPSFPLDIEDDFYAKVGKVSQEMSVYFSSDNQFLGAKIHYQQKGCSHLDKEGNFIERGGHYTSPSDAAKRRCFDNDVSWSGSSTVDHELNDLFSSDFMEWSGH